MSVDWYMEFVDQNYKPSKTDLVCMFRIDPAKGISMKEAAGRVASESSVGTWTTLYRLPPRIKNLKGIAFEIKKNWVKIAYPIDDFELGNMPQVFSSIAGNIFGMKAVKGLRLESIHWPDKMIKSFRGPQFGIPGIRKKFKVYKRPLTATVPKPKLGMNTKEYVKAAEEIWTSGIDFVKNDENMTSQNFVNFYKTTEKMLKLKTKIEKETGEAKMYLANVSSETMEMVKRAKFVADNSGEIVMVDGLTVGWAGMQTLREVCQDLKLAIYMHRAFHSAFTRNPHHGVSMLVIAEVARIIGADSIHVGGMGKLVSPENEVLMLKEEVEKKFVKGNSHVLAEYWKGIKPIFAVTSGGLHPGIIPRLIKLLGRDIIIQAGGGVMGHPKGPFYGGKALRQSIDAAMKNISLKEYAKKHEELALALKKWGMLTPI